jgi:hypothetical protein
MPGFGASVESYLGVSGMGSVGAKDFSSSFTASVHAPQSVLRPLPSMTSCEVSHWFFHSSLNVSRRFSVGSTATGGGGFGVGVTGAVLERLNNFFQHDRPILAVDCLFRQSNGYPSQCIERRPPRWNRPFRVWNCFAGAILALLSFEPASAVIQLISLRTFKISCPCLSHSVLNHSVRRNYPSRHKGKVWPNEVARLIPDPAQCRFAGLD